MFNTLKCDFKRAFRTPRFLISILLVPVMCFLAMGNDLIGSWLVADINFSDCNYFLDAFMGFSHFRTILLVIAAIPFVSAFCNDWEHKYIQPLSARTGILNYSVSKVITVFTSSFAVIFLGLTLFTLILSIKAPFFTDIEGTNSYDILRSNIHYGDILRKSVPLFYIVKFCMQAFFCAFWCVFALMLSALLPNKFLAFSSPFIGFYFLDASTIFIPFETRRFFDMRRLTYSQQCISYNSTLDLLYIYAFFIILSVICGFIFHIIVKRRLGNELV
jgi:hypothetical protein